MTSKHTTKLLRIKDVLKLVPVSKSMWYSLIRKGSAPAPRKITHKCSVWLESDITSFIETLQKPSKV